MTIKEWADDAQQFLGIHVNDIKVELCDDLFSKLYELSSDIQRKIIIKDIDRYRALNGTICCPSEITKEWYVLISTNSIKYQDNHWPGTLAHEISHIDDFINFAKYYNLKTVSDIITHTHYNAFFLWTEYKAKLLGYAYLLLRVVHGEELLSDEILADYVKSINNEKIKVEFNKEKEGFINYVRAIMDYFSQYDFINKISKYKCVPVNNMVSLYSVKERVHIMELYDHLSYCLKFDDFLAEMEAIEKVYNKYYNIMNK